MQFVKAVESNQVDYFVFEEVDLCLFVDDLKASQLIFLKRFFLIENALDKKIFFKNKWFPNFQEFFLARVVF